MRQAQGFGKGAIGTDLVYWYPYGLTAFTQLSVMFMKMSYHNLLMVLVIFAFISSVLTFARKNYVGDPATHRPPRVISPPNVSESHYLHICRMCGEIYNATEALCLEDKTFEVYRVCAYNLNHR
ncbi:hypothetical protein Btru_072747 [Bulinus truncatus]|nr:hypothetical protein Btru_072747 [Bulinus truncatus]